MDIFCKFCDIWLFADFRGLPIENTFSSSLDNGVTLIATEKCFKNGPKSKFEKMGQLQGL